MMPRHLSFLLEIKITIISPFPSPFITLSLSLPLYHSLSLSLSLFLSLPPSLFLSLSPSLFLFLFISLSLPLSLYLSLWPMKRVCAPSSPVRERERKRVRELYASVPHSVSCTRKQKVRTCSNRSVSQSVYVIIILTLTPKSNIWRQAYELNIKVESAKP